MNTTSTGALPTQAPPEQTSPKPPKRLRGARNLGIVATILSALELIWMVYTTSGIAAMIPGVLGDPEMLQATEESGIAPLIASLGFGGLSNAEALAAVLAFVVLFMGFGAVMCLVSLVAGISLTRAAKSPETHARRFALGLLGGGAAILTLRFVSGILLIAGTLKVRNQEIERQGGPDVYYADGRHLGFMRFVEFACLAEIIANVTLLLFVTRTDGYDGAWWINFVMLLMMAVTYWVIWNRRQHGCTIICVMVAAYLVMNAVYYVAIGSFNPLQFAFDSFWPIVMLAYFGFSKRAHATLVKPFRMETRAAELKEEEKLWNLKSPVFWRNLVLYFCIFSVVGHWMEWSVCWLIRWGIVPGTYDPNSGIWHDMLNPFFVYGAAFVIIGLILFPLKNWLMKVCKGKLPVALLASFVINTLFCAAIELVLGFTANMPPDPVTGKLPLWDYSDMAFNFMGQICLLNTTFFGVMATLMTWLVYPAMEKAFSNIPKDIMNMITVVVVLFFVLVVCMYVINLDLASLSANVANVTGAIG